MRIWGLAIVAVLALAGCRASEPVAASGEAEGQAAKAVSPAGLDLVDLTIEGAGKSHHFAVELAQTPEQQAKGLMFRTELAPDAGMIFPFDPPRPASFWMKNTVIPLDMIFIERDGTIQHIAANTVPYSIDPVASRGEVAAVLEIAGGRAEQLGLAVGDKVRWDHPSGAN